MAELTAEQRETNARIFESLNDPASRAASDAVNDWTRSRLFHKFTRMPVRGFMPRIMPPIEIQSITYWATRGVPERDLVAAHAPRGQIHYHPWWETGALLYEIIERKLDREDYQRRLADRTVSRWEWRTREQSRRRLANSVGLPAPEPVAVAALARLVGQCRNVRGVA